MHTVRWVPRGLHNSVADSYSRFRDSFNTGYKSLNLGPAESIDLSYLYSPRNRTAEISTGITDHHSEDILNFYNRLSLLLLYRFYCKFIWLLTRTEIFFYDLILPINPEMQTQSVTNFESRLFSDRMMDGASFDEDVPSNHIKVCKLSFLTSVQGAHVAQ